MHVDENQLCLQGHAKKVAFHSISSFPSLEAKLAFHTINKTHRTLSTVCSEKGKMNDLRLVTNIIKEKTQYSRRTIMAHGETWLLLLQTLALLSVCSITANSVVFDFPSVFNFGDSNSDTGNLIAAGIESLNPPNGQSYFGIPSGRYCDGRLIVDFLSKAFTIPFTTIIENY